MSDTSSSSSSSTSVSARVTCVFCGNFEFEEDPTLRVVPLSLRHRAFAHAPCTQKYCRRRCEWCSAAPVDVGERVLGIGLRWQGEVKSFPAEVVGRSHKEDSSEPETFTLCFADASELDRVKANKEWEALVRRSELQLTQSGATEKPATTSSSLVPDPGALYDHGLMLAFGLCGLRRDRTRAVAAWRLAAELGHPSAALGIAVPRNQVQGICMFHRSPEVKSWWRVLPPTLLASSLDVRPEEVLDGVLGSPLADAAGAPNDPVGRAHAAWDALVGAFGVVVRSLHTPTAALAPPGGRGGGGGGTGGAVEGSAPTSASSGAASSSSSGAAGRGGPGGVDMDDVGAWYVFLKQHIETLNTCIQELPGQHRTRAQQLARIAELQQTLKEKREALDEALAGAKAELAEGRVRGQRLLKIARCADDESIPSLLKSDGDEVGADGDPSKDEDEGEVVVAAMKEEHLNAVKVGEPERDC